MWSESWSISRAVLISVIAVVLVATACQSDGATIVTARPNAAEDAPAAEVTAEPEAGDVPPTTPPTPEASADEAPALEQVDLTGVASADAEAARSVLALAAVGDEREMASGPWFSSTYSEPLAFVLPEPARLIDQGLGWTTIEVGDPGSSVHGRIRIIEAVAFSSPDGPVPISLIGPDSELADTTLLAKGTAESLRGEISWRDVVLDSERVPQQFQKPCGFDAGEACVDTAITEGGPVLIELDRTTRFVAQPFGSRRLYVIATALGADEEAVLDQAFNVAASIITTDRTEDATRRPLSTIGMRADALPAGSWFVELADVVVDLTLSEDVTGVSILDTGTTWFALQSADDDGETLVFSVQVFQGFVEGALSGEDAATGLPLPADVFLRGIDAIAPIEEQGSAMIGGYEGQWYQVGDPPSDSPFACTAFERRDLDPDETCAVFSTDGWRFVDSPDRSHDYRHHYIEELGVIVGYPGVRGVDGLLIEPRFQLLLEALALTAG